MLIKIRRSFFDMVRGRMMLAVVISIIVTSREPIDEELTESCPVLQPIEVHVDGLRALLFYCIVCEAGARSVVYLDGSGRLGMAELFECGSYGDGLASRHKGCRNFGFGDRAHDVSHDLGYDVERTVDRRCGFRRKI